MKGNLLCDLPSGWLGSVPHRYQLANHHGGTSWPDGSAAAKTSRTSSCIPLTSNHTGVTRELQLMR